MNNLFKNNSYENERNIEITNSTIIIPKRYIPQLRKASGFFEAFIDTDFSNSKNFFTKNGSYILKEHLVPDSITYYDRNTNEDYVIKKKAIWDALPGALKDGHVSDPILAKFIADYFMFHGVTSFYNPTLPESNVVSKPYGSYIPSPSKAELKRLRKLNSELGINNYIKNNENNNYDYIYGYMQPISREELLKNYKEDNKKYEILKIKKELRKENKDNVENLVEAFQSKLKSNMVKTIKALRKRNTPGKNKAKLPGTLRANIKQKIKEKRYTSKRRNQRERKTRKQFPNRNNNNNNYDEYNN